MKSNFLVLLAAKQQREGKRRSLRQVAVETGVKPYTVYGFANNTLREFPSDAIAKLCDYFGCEVGDLLHLEDAPERMEAQP